MTGCHLQLGLPVAPSKPAEDGHVTRTTYEATVRCWEHGWELHIDGLGVTQSRTLHDAEFMVRDYVAQLLGVPSDCFDVKVTLE